MQVWEEERTALGERERGQCATREMRAGAPSTHWEGSLTFLLFCFFAPLAEHVLILLIARFLV